MAVSRAITPVFHRRKNRAHGVGRYRTRCAFLSALLSPPADELNVTEGVNAGVEGAADDGRGFVFDDDGGGGDHAAGQQVAALVDCPFDELAGLRVEDRARAPGLRRMELGSRWPVGA